MMNHNIAKTVTNYCDDIKHIKKTQKILSPDSDEYDICVKIIRSNKNLLKNLLKNIMGMFNNFRSYDEYGITLLHRDSTIVNIMGVNPNINSNINNPSELKFIDLASLKTEIRFSDGGKIILGNFFDDYYNMKMGRQYDMQLFFVHSVVFTDLFEELEIDNKISDILFPDADSSDLVDINDPLTVWVYPYKKPIDYSTLRVLIERCIDSC
jgi:hypothetical protein